MIDQKLAASAGAYYRGSSLDDATFQIYASPRPGVSLDQIEAAVEAELARLAEQPISEEEVARSTRRLVGEAVYARDSLSSAVRSFGVALATGRTVEDVEAWPARIAAVTAEEVNAAAAHVFRPERSVTGRLSPARRRHRRRAGRRAGGRGGRQGSAAEQRRTSRMTMVERGWKVVLSGALALGVLATSPPAGAAAKVERVVSPGGIEAYLVSEPSIPFLSMSIHFAGGSALDPSGKEGLAYMVSGLLDEGAGALDSQAFRTELEDLAIRLSFDAQRDSFTGELKTLSEHRRRAFELLRQALVEPRFDPEPVERIRHQIEASLRRSSEDPDYLASLTWFETAFAGQPYGRPVRGTLESVAGLDDRRPAHVRRRPALPGTT